MNKQYILKEIVNGIAKAEQDIRNLEIEYNAKIKMQQDTIKRLQKKCGDELKHPIGDYHPDASGNNDSYDTCAICGLDS